MSVKSTLLLSAFALASLGAGAQSVTVYMKNGNSFKYNTDNVKEITFEDTSAPVPEAVALDQILIQAYYDGNVGITMSNDNGDAVGLDLYGPTTATYLEAGTYTVNSTNNPFTIDTAYPGVSYIKKADGTSTTYKAGTVTVANEGNHYTITGDLTLTDDTPYLFKYEGDLTSYCPNPEPINVGITLTEAEYLDTPQRPGEFYVKLHDAAWNVEMALDIQADASAKTLPAGTYKFQDAAEAGAGYYSNKSYLDSYTPYFEVRDMGDVTVTQEGENYYITFSFKYGDVTYNGNFSGAISGTPLFEGNEDPEPPTPVFEGVEMTSIEFDGTGYNAVPIFTAENGDKVKLDTYSPYEGASFFRPATYVLNGDGQYYISTQYDGWTYVETDGVQKTLKSGALTVTREGRVYTMIGDFILSDDSNYKFYYVGELPVFGPYTEVTLTVGEYGEKNTPHRPGEFYLKLRDANWNAEATLDIQADPAATTLPAGTYRLSTADVLTPGFYSAKSSVSSWGANYFNDYGFDGTVTVEENAGVYTIVIAYATAEGREVNVTFNGEITGTPAFYQGHIMDTLTLSSYKGRNTGLKFNAANGDELNFDTYSIQGALFLCEGIYKAANGTDDYTFDVDPSYTNATIDGEAKTIAVEGSSFTIMRNERIYNISGTLTFTDGTTYDFLWEGQVPSFSPYIDLTLTSAEYYDQADSQRPGEFYIKFSGEGVEAALNFQSAADATTLAPGMYTYAYTDPMGENEYNPGKSYVDIYTPYVSLRQFYAGINVAKEGNIYTITFDTYTNEGLTVSFKFEGEITGTPLFNNTTEPVSAPQRVTLSKQKAEKGRMLIPADKLLKK